MGRIYHFCKCRCLCLFRLLSDHGPPGLGQLRLFPADGWDPRGRLALLLAACKPMPVLVLRRFPLLVTLREHRLDLVLLLVRPLDRNGMGCHDVAERVLGHRTDNLVVVHVTGALGGAPNNCGGSVCSSRSSRLLPALLAVWRPRDAQRKPRTVWQEVVCRPRAAHV